MGTAAGGERPPIDLVPRDYARYRARSRVWFWSSLGVAALMHLLIFWLDPGFRVVSPPRVERAAPRTLTVFTLPSPQRVKLAPSEARAARGGKPAGKPVAKHPRLAGRATARPVPAPPREPTTATATAALTREAERAIATAQGATLGSAFSIPGPALPGPPLPLPPAPKPADEFDRYTPVNPSMDKPDLINRAQVKRALYREYPRALQSAGVGGVALVWFWIDEKGKVRKYEVRQSTGEPALDAAAERVIPMMKFRPAKRNGKGIPVIAALPIRFEVP